MGCIAIFIALSVDVIKGDAISIQSKQFQVETFTHMWSEKTERISKFNVDLHVVWDFQIFLRLYHCNGVCPTSDPLYYNRLLIKSKRNLWKERG